MGKVAENISKFLEQIPEHVKLVAVSKTKPNEAILDAYQVGHRIFGENKVQDLSVKAAQLPNDIEWHFIGHLQTNKVKYIAPFISMIEAVDSLKLLKEINKQAKKNQRKIKCLLQFHIAEEESKFGLSMHDAQSILNSEQYSSYENIDIVGVMGMATYTDNDIQVRSEFARLKGYFDDLKEKYFQNNDHFKEISMGMSGDFRMAIEEGSTMIRVGSAIFGARNI